DGPGPPASRPVHGGRGATGDRHAVVRAVRVRLHPLPPRRHRRAAAVLGDLRRQRDGHLLLLRGGRVPGRIAAEAGPGRRGRQGVGAVGTGRDGAELDQCLHVQRLYRGVPNLGGGQYVAPVQIGVGPGAVGAIPGRDGGRGRGRAARLPVVRDELVEL